MANYYLFLDESQTHDQGRKAVFGIAGVIVEESNYNNIIIPEIQNLKRQVWADLPNPEQIILHEMDIKNAHKGVKKYPELIRFRRKGVMKQLYDGIGNIFDLGLMKVIGACIDEESLKDHFNGPIAVNKDIIAMQIIFENFTQFLERSDSRGIVFCESRGESEDIAVKIRLNQIQVMGSLFVNPIAMQKYIREIRFPCKHENVIGLQVADFVPNPFVRKCANKPSIAFNLYQHVRTARYDGGLGKHDRFGVKFIP